MALVGRSTEAALLASLVSAPRDGSGAGMLLLGDAGMGKTVLVEEAVASASGVRVLRALGYEGESQLAYAGLTQLLGPVLGALDAVPPPQAAALRAALALGPPVVMDRFAAYAATLSLLAAASRSEPLLLVVDDAHWFDVPSAEAIAFCARRLGDDPVAILLAARSAEGRWLRELGFPEHELAPLDEEAAERLLASAAPGLAARARDGLLALAAGNPLALVELPSSLDDDERTGRRPLREPLRPTEAVRAAFGRRIDELPETARAALTVLACSGDGRMEVVDAAIAVRQLPGTALAPAIAAGLVRAEGARYAFRHPLLRPVVLDLASRAQVRAAHRALAASLAPHEVEQRGRHLGEAAIGQDEDAAGALEAAAGMAAARTGYSSAADAMERAAQLSPEPDRAAGRRLAAGQMALAAGESDRALAMLDRAATGTSVPPLRAQIGRMRGVVRLLATSLDDAYATLVAEADAAAAFDPVLAATMLADAVLSRTMAGECDQAVTVASRAYGLVRTAHATPPSVSGYLSGALLLAGRRREGERHVAALERAVDALDPLSPDGTVVLAVSTWHVWGGDLRAGHEQIERWTERARQAGALGFLGLVLAYASEVDFRLGDWTRAAARAAEAVELLEETGQRNVMGYALTNLAVVEAGYGREDAVASRVARALALAEPLGIGSVVAYAARARGFLAIGLSRPEEVVDALAPMSAFTRARGLREPSVVPWQPDLVEALARLGRHREAREVLADLAAQAEVSGGTWGLAATSRCRGLLDPGFDGHFRRALALHERVPMPFETARTQLAYGARLRRDRRRGEARAQLEAALATFAALGATPWADQAREELEVAGSAPRRDEAHRDDLTARESQVALAVYDGLSNREIAHRLFISEKSVERHLSAIYGKLGVRSRTQLVARMAGDRSAS